MAGAGVSDGEAMKGAVSWKSKAIYRPIGSANLVLYDGPSQLTGERILVIATAQNGNRKIGNMLQLWIVPAISPIAAVKSGADAAVCGDCKMRGDGNGKQRSCYVEWWRAVENIWQNWNKGKAKAMSPLEFATTYPGLQLRIGAYGDPVAVPVDVWEVLLSTAAGWTAYTHQWPSAPAGFQGWCMASVDTVEEQRTAAALGWRCYRDRLESEPLLDSELVCPASVEGGHKALCAGCSLCRGLSRPAKHIAIVAHGTGAAYIPANRLRRSALVAQ
jgi:hypothetical protein